MNVERGLCMSPKEMTARPTAAGLFPQRAKKWEEGHQQLLLIVNNPDAGGKNVYGRLKLARAVAAIATVHYSKGSRRPQRGRILWSSWNMMLASFERSWDFQRHLQMVGEDSPGRLRTTLGVGGVSMKVE